MWNSSSGGLPSVSRTPSSMFTISYEAIENIYLKRELWSECERTLLTKVLDFSADRFMLRNGRDILALVDILSKIPEEIKPRVTSLKIIFHEDFSRWDICYRQEVAELLKTVKEMSGLKEFVCETTKVGKFWVTKLNVDSVWNDIVTAEKEILARRGHYIGVAAAASATAGGLR
jgi:hypothetical protein